MKEFNLNLFEKLFYPFLFLIASIGVFKLLPTPGNYQYYQLILSWLTFMALFFGFFMNFYRALILKPFRTKAFFFFLLFLSFLFFIFAGQKISWGRELMGDSMEGIFSKTLLIVLILLYFIIMPLLYRFLKKGKYWLDYCGVPIPKLIHLVLFILMAVFVARVESPLSEYLLEFGFSWIIFLMVLRPYNRELYSRSSLKR